VTKVNTPAKVIASSDPDTAKVTDVISVAVTVPIAVWFSAAVKLAEDVNTGAVVSTTLTVLVAIPALSEASVDV
jgi:hypothetical protein